MLGGETATTRGTLSLTAADSRVNLDRAMYPHQG